MVKHYRVTIPIDERVNGWKQYFQDGNVYRKAATNNHDIGICKVTRTIKLIGDDNIGWYVDEECCTEVVIKPEISW